MFTKVIIFFSIFVLSTTFNRAAASEVNYSTNNIQIPSINQLLSLNNHYFDLTNECSAYYGRAIGKLNNAYQGKIESSGGFISGGATIASVGCGIGAIASAISLATLAPVGIALCGLSVGAGGSIAAVGATSNTSSSFLEELSDSQLEQLYNDRLFAHSLLGIIHKRKASLLKFWERDTYDPINCYNSKTVKQYAHQLQEQDATFSKIETSEAVKLICDSIVAGSKNGKFCETKKWSGAEVFLWSARDILSFGGKQSVRQVRSRK